MYRHVGTHKLPFFFLIEAHLFMGEYIIREPFSLGRVRDIVASQSFVIVENLTDCMADFTICAPRRLLSVS